MKKRSHKLLASTLLECEHGFQARRYEWAFLFGSFQPDCNPLTYLKGSLRAYKFRGHNFSNSQAYINNHILRLQRRTSWSIWQYYTLGKLTHYLADAYTYPHNEDYPDSMMDHHNYETGLRQFMRGYLSNRHICRQQARRDRRPGGAPRAVYVHPGQHVPGRQLHPQGHQPADVRLPARRLIRRGAQKNRVRPPFICENLRFSFSGRCVML